MEPDINVKYAREVVAKDPMAVHLGIRVEEVRHAYAKLSLEIVPKYLNALDRAHGIAISSVIDQAVAVASNTMEHKALVVELKINFLRAVSLGDTIIAEAGPLDITHKLSMWQVEVKDSFGKKVALARALTYHRATKSG